MRSVDGRNVVMRRITVRRVTVICTSCIFVVIRVSTPVTTTSSHKRTDKQTAKEADNAKVQQQQQGE